MRTTFTPRQREIVKRLSEGESPKEIGYALGLASKTVEYHSAQARKKIGDDSIAVLTRVAIISGISSLYNNKNKRLLAVGAALWLVCVLAWGGGVTLTWDASPDTNVTSYNIYFGTNTGVYSYVTNAGLVLTQSVVLPHGGQWFFAATAVDATNYGGITLEAEGEFSNEVSWLFNTAPGATATVGSLRIGP